MKPDEIQQALTFNAPQVPHPRFTLPKITPATHYLSGEAAFIALRNAVGALADSAPNDHDVLVEAFGIRVLQIRYVKPHTLIFEGLDPQGHKTSVVAHFSQLIAHVIYLPKSGETRVITGFAQT